MVSVVWGGWGLWDGDFGLEGLRGVFFGVGGGGRGGGRGKRWDGGGGEGRMVSVAYGREVEGLGVGWLRGFCIVGYGAVLIVSGDKGVKN